ncbi:hypothetical protein N7495_005052 [Penicillium taxi]|uniref:uncharacterized protein n=1 Tax=Penicillium taxi TaxID=168475 RepID=UPI00254515C4|nr:uncharacterized protein N7495_005052 [Penicillium taxi]KAJ5893361.1 hypothetical protein N7495_005052 [Penicillium taxi]
MSSADTATSCRFSTRISLRWLPEPAHETTDTIVMSVNGWYLDLRIDLKTNDIDWAIAGQRVVESEEPLRVAFTHELDSHNAFESVDCGTFVTLPNGDDLETGEMPRHDLPGAPVAEYEEVWRELPFRESPEGTKKGISWVLESDDGDLSEIEGEVTVRKIFLGRIWGTFLALQQDLTHVRQRSPSGEWLVTKTGGVVSARREEWSDGWMERYAVGRFGGSLPSMARGIQGMDSWETVGERIDIDGRPFILRAFEEFSYANPTNAAFLCYTRQGLRSLSSGFIARDPSQMRNSEESSKPNPLHLPLVEAGAGTAREGLV